MSTPRGPKRPSKPARRASSSARRTESAPLTSGNPSGNHAPASPPTPEAAGKKLRSAQTAPASRIAAPERQLKSDPQGKYVYCVIHSSEPLQFGRIGIGQRPSNVYTVNYKDIAAAVSDTPLQVYDATRENVIAHESVNELIMKGHTVIPMSFGTVFKTRDDIIELLRSAYEAFSDVLHKMQDKLEFGLKVLWEPQEVVRQIENEEEDIRRLKEEILSRRGPTYFAKVQYDRLVGAAVEARSERYVKSIMDELRDVCVASRWNKPIGDKMILNAAFLVARDRETAFDARVKEVGSRLNKLNFRYTDPWPPYNFVNIRLKLEKAKGTE